MSKRLHAQCSVCCERFTVRDRKVVCCSFCNYSEACAACYQTYLVSVEIPQCMSCHREWSLDFLSSTFMKSWINGPYKAHREKLLLDSEMALLPASQHLVTNYNMAKTLTQAMKANENRQLELQNELWVLRTVAFNSRERIERIRGSGYHSDGVGNEGNSRTFSTRCPAEGCRGFLETETRKCGTCGVTACRECFGVQSEDHTCSTSDIETAKLLSRDTRPCPKCAVPIHKIDGCDMMWCTQCHTAFSWRSGNPLRQGARFHNPEYVRYLREHRANGEIPRELGDIRCGRELPPLHRWNSFMNRIMRSVTNSERTDLGTTYHALRRIHFRILGHQNRLDHPNHRDNSDLRLQYLLGKLSQDDWKRELMIRKSREDKEEAFRAVYATVYDSALDILLNVYERPATHIKTGLQELHTLFEYSNTEIKALQRRFNNCTAYFLPNNFYSSKNAFV